MIFRGSIAQWGFAKAQSKLAQKGMELSVSKIEFEGIFGIRLEKVDLKRSSPPRPVPQFFHSDSLSFSLNLWRTLFKGVSIQNLHLLGTQVYYYDSAGVKNIEFKREKKSDESQEKDGGSILSTVKDLIAKMPSDLLLQRFSVTFQDSNKFYRSSIPHLTYNNQELDGTVHLVNNGLSSHWKVAGNLDKKTLEGKLKVNAINSQNIISAFGGTFAMKSGEFEITDLSELGSGFSLESDGVILGMMVNHKRIADTSVYFQNISCKTKVLWKDEEIELDSNSEFKLNKLTMFAGGIYNYSASPKYKILFKIPETSANNFFGSLPRGLFPNTAGIKANGSLNYRFEVALDDKKLSETVFKSDMNVSKDFKVTQWGLAHPSKINGSFVYRHYKQDRLVREMVIGESNPFFASYDQISPEMVKAILRSEDPQFFYHRGFYTEAFRMSLIQNYRAKRFARGGSTISMQLVKNAYLNQQKTLARKVEEIIIVWLLERERAVSKNRMMEVYLNLIEWGPNVYGIGEASYFYFGKAPYELNIGEAAYLASLVPAPSHARYSIDSSGRVKPRWGRFNGLRNRLMRLDSAGLDSTMFMPVIRMEAVRRLGIIKSEPEEQLPDEDNQDDIFKTPLIMRDPQNPQ